MLGDPNSPVLQVLRLADDDHDSIQFPNVPSKATTGPED